MPSRPSTASTALVLTLAALLVPADAGAGSCAVTAVEGSGARYWQDGVWSELRAAVALTDEAKVATGPDARVELACDDGTVVTVGTGTEVNLERLAAPDRNGLLQLIDGIIGLVVPRAAGRRFEVRTPVAIAAVRSTEWLVEFDPSEGAAVFVRAGRVAVTSLDGRQFVLDRGEGITISGDGKPGAVKVWGQPRIAQSTAALGFGWR